MDWGGGFPVLLTCSTPRPSQLLHFTGLLALGVGDALVGVAPRLRRVIPLLMFFPVGICGW